MPAYLPTLNWPIYSGWTAFTPTIPKMYWNVYSQEQRIKDLCMNYDKCEQYLDFVAQLTNNWVGEYTEEVQQKLDEFEALLDFGSETTITKWIEKNLDFIFKQVVTQVYFGLTLDGRFVAYIPESWSDIIFDTGMVYELDTYGRLILRWDVDSPYDNVDQIPEVVRPYSDEELEIKIRNIMNTLYSSGD